MCIAYSSLGSMRFCAPSLLMGITVCVYHGKFHRMPTNTAGVMSISKKGWAWLCQNICIQTMLSLAFLQTASPLMLAPT